MPDREFFDPEAETLPREQLRARQEARILELVPYAYERSAFYRELWDAHGVHPRDIRSLEDFRAHPVHHQGHGPRLPGPHRRPLRRPALRPAVEELTSVSSSSGTTG